MRPAGWFAAAVTIAVTIIIGVCGAQDPDPTTIERRRQLAARVARLKEGKAPTARSPAGSRPLGERDPIAAGEEVTAGDGPVELLFPTDPEQAKDGTVDAGERLVLGPGARATVAPLDTTVDVRLESGQAVARSIGDLRVQAGDSVVVVRSGDAAIDVSRGAGGAVDVRVDVLAGQVDVEGAGVRRGAAPGDRVDVDARGQRVRRGQAKAPKFADALDAVAPTAVRVFERFQAWPAPFVDPTARPRRHGEAFPAGSPATVGSEAPYVAEGDTQSLAFCAASVHFGFGGAEDPGYFQVGPSTRLRLRYRASRPARLWVIVRKKGSHQHASGKVPMRAGVWTDLELHPSRFQVPGETPGPAFDAGAVSYVDVCAGEPEETGLKLELQHVLVYE